MNNGIFGGFGDAAAYSPDRTKPITEMLTARLRRENVGQSIFGERVYTSNGVPERINPSWTVGPDRPAPISGFGFGEVDAQGFEKAPIMGNVLLSDNKTPARCGVYGEYNITWDKNWPCDSMDRLRTAVIAYMRWRGTDSKGADYIQEMSSLQPGGVEPYGKDWWITQICNGQTSPPEGFPMPDACNEPARKASRDAAEAIRQQATLLAQTKMADLKAPASLVVEPSSVPANTQAPVVVAPKSNLALYVGFGIAAVTVGAIAFGATRKKGGAVAPKAA